MQITRIELSNFRNHPSLVLEEIGRLLIIVGNNAVGKTNIIEALQLLSMHESFRRPKAEELVFNQKEPAGITYLSIDIENNNTVNTKKLALVEGKKVFSFNKKERPARELLDLVPAVLFTPDDLQAIKGPPEQRRDLLDSLGTRLSKTFGQIRSEYYKAVRHKNSLLRQEEVDRTLLDSWNINVAKLGASLSKHRRGLLEQLMENTTYSYKKISGGELLRGIYTVSWQTPDSGACLSKTPDEDSLSEECLYEALQQKQEEEISMKRSLVGPQKDDILFLLNNKDARRFASQGQQRSIVLALKIAEIEILRRVSNKEPLLLLDDVMSELDTARRGFFIDLISEAGQTIITTTNLGYFEERLLEHATIVCLDDPSQKSAPNE